MGVKTSDMFYLNLFPQKSNLSIQADTWAKTWGGAMAHEMAMFCQKCNHDSRANVRLVYVPYKFIREKVREVPCLQCGKNMGIFL